MSRFIGTIFLGISSIVIAVLILSTMIYYAGLIHYSIHKEEDGEIKMIPLKERHSLWQYQLKILLPEKITIDDILNDFNLKIEKPVNEVEEKEGVINIKFKKGEIR